MTDAPESNWNVLSQAADDLTLSGKSRELFFVKMMEREIAVLQKEKEKEIAVLEKEKEIAVLQKEKEIAVLEKEKEIAVLKKEKEIAVLEKEKEIAVEKFKLEFKSKFENELAATGSVTAELQSMWATGAAAQPKVAKLQHREAALLQPEVC